MGTAQGRNSHFINARPCFHGLSQGANLSHWFVEPLVFDFMKPGMLVHPEDVLRVLAHLKMARPPSTRQLGE